MSNRVDRYCLSCGNVTVVDAGHYAGSYFYQCETCGRRGMSDIFPQATVFHRITASPEVLAEAIVYEEREHSILSEKGCGAIFPGGWTSSIIEYSYSTKEESIAATVAKLKEVCHE